MILRLAPALLLAASALPVLAQFAPTAEERLRALTGPRPTDLYGEEKSADLSRIAAESQALFAGDAAIALFIGPDCGDCTAAQAELTAVANELGLTLNVFSLDAPEHAARYDRLGFDALPAYVMPDRLIRGHMPDFVLRDYLSGE